MSDRILPSSAGFIIGRSGIVEYSEIADQTRDLDPCDILVVSDEYRLRGLLNGKRRADPTFRVDLCGARLTVSVLRSFCADA